ncbi:MAG: flavin reductase family protein [Thermodesulfobacteriota bacterium]|nr:flavin reductase family protein [Thermodesulfobacteriota bacterium]
MKKIKLGPQTLLFPMPAVLVGSTVGGKPNFMTAAWCGIASHQPPALAVAIREIRFTMKGIEANQSFSINVPSADLAKKVDFCGIYSGKKKDKSKIFQVYYGDLKTAPLIEECPVNLECKVIHSIHLGSHTLVVGEIMETHINDNCLTEGNADAAKIDPLVYSTGTAQYQRLGEVIGKAFHMGKE